MDKQQVIDRLIHIMTQNHQRAEYKQSKGELDNYAYAYHCGYEQALRDAIKAIESENERSK